MQPRLLTNNSCSWKLKIVCEQDESVIHHYPVLSRHHLLMLIAPSDGLLEISHPSCPLRLHRPATFRQAMLSPPADSVLRTSTARRTGTSSCSHMFLTSSTIAKLHHFPLWITDIKCGCPHDPFRFSGKSSPPQPPNFPSEEAYRSPYPYVTRNFSSCAVPATIFQTLSNTTSSAMRHIRKIMRSNMKHTRHVLTFQCRVPPEQSLPNQVLISVVHKRSRRGIHLCKAPLLTFFVFCTVIL
jgi:hypothetical protein